MKRAALFLILVLFTAFSSATVTSVDSISYNSNSDYFDGEVYAITFNIDQATDSIDVTLDENQLEQAVDGDVNQELNIDFTDLDSKLRYSTTTSSGLRNIVTVAGYHEDGFTSESSAKTDAKANCYDLVLDGYGDYYWNNYVNWGAVDDRYEYWCFQENDYLGSPATLDDPDRIFSVNAEVSASGETVQSKPLSNSDIGAGRSTSLGEHVRVNWNGNLPTGDTGVDEGNVLALYSNQYDNGWRIINKDDYDIYNNYITNRAFPSLSDWANYDLGNGGMTKSGVEDLVNNKAERAAEIDTSSDLSDAEVTDDSFQNGEFTYDTEDILDYPQFTVYVDAGEDGYIEVNKETGEPEIVSTQGAEVSETDDGTVEATVQNVGGGEGSFSARLTDCNNGFEFSDTQRTKQVASGQAVTYNFDVSFTSDSTSTAEVDGSCTFEVEDTGSNEEDSANIGLTGIQEPECSAGDEKREQRSDGIWEIYECQENEVGWNLQTTCNPGEKAVAQGGNQYSCVSQTDCDPGDEYREKNDDDRWEIFQCKDDGSGYEVKETCGENEKAVEKGDDNFVCEGQGGGLLEQIHLALSVLAGLVAGFIGYKGVRWVDGEYQVKGGFKPLKSRNLSRVKRGRLVIGLLAGLLAFGIGTFVALQIPLVVQLIVIVGGAGIAYYFR